MNCDSFEMRLDELLDERLPPDSDIELNEHADGCPQCARLMADHQSLLEAVELLARPRMHAGLAAQVLEQMALEPVAVANEADPRHLPTPSRSTSARRFAPPVATWIAATAAVLLVGIGVVRWNKVHRAAMAAAVKTPTATETDVPKIVFENPAAKAAAGSRDSIVAQSVAEIQAATGPTGVPYRTLMEQMTDGLKPVTHSMSAAIHALRRTFPGSESPARSS